jgi:hypothetical protein
LPFLPFVARKNLKVLTCSDWFDSIKRADVSGRNDLFA